MVILYTVIVCTLLFLFIIVSLLFIIVHCGITIIVECTLYVVAILLNPSITRITCILCTTWSTIHWRKRHHFELARTDVRCNVMQRQANTGHSSVISVTVHQHCEIHACSFNFRELYLSTTLLL